MTAQTPPPEALDERQRIGFNRLEFLLDFAQACNGSRERVHAHLVAAPAHVKQFAELMQGCIRDYEQRYGSIAVEREH